MKERCWPKCPGLFVQHKNPVGLLSLGASPFIGWRERAVPRFIRQVQFNITMSFFRIVMNMALRSLLLAYGMKCKPAPMHFSWRHNQWTQESRCAVLNRTAVCLNLAGAPCLYLPYAGGLSGRWRQSLPTNRGRGPQDGGPRERASRRLLAIPSIGSSIQRFNCSRLCCM